MTELLARFITFTRTC